MDTAMTSRMEPTAEYLALKDTARRCSARLPAMPGVSSSSRCTAGSAAPRNAMSSRPRWFNRSGTGSQRAARLGQSAGIEADLVRKLDGAVGQAVLELREVTTKADATPEFSLRGHPRSHPRCLGQR